MEQSEVKYGYLFYTGEGDDTYRLTEYFKSSIPDDTIDILMCINERFVALVTIVTNFLVIMVFARVLGLARLASSLIVSVACSNVVKAMAIFLHSVAVTNVAFSNSQLKCRILYVVHTTSSALQWSCLACAVLERLLAISMPSCYFSASWIIAPTLVSAPWVYYAYRLVLSVSLSERVFLYDMGFACSDHVMHAVINDPIQLLPTPAECITVTLTLTLALSRVLHPPHYDDVWESNRLRLEYKTTAIMFQVIVPTCILWLPMVAASAAVEFNEANQYKSLLLKHLCFQVGIYNGPLIFAALLIRKEFRKAFRLVFAKKDDIRITRQINYLLAAGECTRQQKSLSATKIAVVPHKTTGLELEARDDYRTLIDENELSSHKKMFKY